MMTNGSDVIVAVVAEERRRASPEVRACAEATDRLVAAVTRQRAATAARGLVLIDASASETEGSDDDAPSCVSSLSESEDGDHRRRRRRVRSRDPSRVASVATTGRIHRNPARIIGYSTRPRDP